MWWGVTDESQKAQTLLSKKSRTKSTKNVSYWEIALELGVWSGCWLWGWGGCPWKRRTGNVVNFLSSSSLFPSVPSRTLACGTRPRKHNKRGSVASLPCSPALPWGLPDHRSQATWQTSRMSRPASRTTSNRSHSVPVNYPHLLCRTRSFSRSPPAVHEQCSIMLL